MQDPNATPVPPPPPAGAPVPEAAASPRQPLTTLAPQVVVPALLVLGGLLVFCGFFPQRADLFFNGAQHWVVGHFDWFYTVAVTVFLVFLLMVAASRFGDIRLGPDDAVPEFNFLSWTAMLFAAGMGIGLMYFGVGEPLQHFLKPPTQIGGTPAAAKEALQVTFFHWGFHAWAVYGTMGLVLAYFGFRYNLPLTLRSGLYPLLKERINGPIGHCVDAFALVGTIAGIATTLGYGALQLAAGLHKVGGWDTSTNAFRIGIIAVVVLLAGISAVSGLDKGVRRLSEFNLSLSFLLLGFVIIAGPTVYLFQALSENIGGYLSNLVNMSLRTFVYEPTRDPSWFGNWTILYWAWWISWSPFVGMFIARISRGRTIRQFIIGVLLVPTAFNLLWMTSRGIPRSPVWQRLFWAAILGVTAAVLLLAGGLGALQAMTLVAALPVAVIMLALCYGLWRGLQADVAHSTQDLAPATNFWSGQHWRRRLEQIVHQSTRQDVLRFMQTAVLQAMRDVARELSQRGVAASVHEGDLAEGVLRLTIPDPTLRDFVYGVKAVSHAVPVFIVREAARQTERDQVFEPMTFFEDGRQGYDIQYLRTEEIIVDILRHYERYRTVSINQQTQLLNRAPGHTDPLP